MANDEKKAITYIGSELVPQQSIAQGSIINADHLHRRLNNRQIQLIAIGGSIGTGLFVSIANGLYDAGPAGLLLAFLVYSGVVALVNNGMAEMVVQYPVAGGFVRLAGHFVGDSFGFMAGWTYCLYEALVIPFEISALAVVVRYWSDDVPIWSMCLVCIVLYIILNCFAVNAYGESEFWLSSGKIFLVLGLFRFTFITMVGGNPKHDAYGFRHWNNPGPFAEYRSKGSLGRFEGFLSALWTASFCIVGPEYVSLVAAEARHPRTYIKSAYKTIYYRFFLFFIGSALAVGIVLASDDPSLVAILIGTGSGGGTAAASPYVIAMKNLGISVLPHIVNALLVTSIFSAGNTYVYCTSRSLYGLAVEGRAPGIFKKCTKQGVPIYALALTMCFACLSFLQSSSKTSNALGILVSLVTGGALINYFVMSVTYVYFYRALKAQGFDRSSLPYRGWFQPYCAYFASAFYFIIIVIFGYTTFAPFDVEAFFSCYMMTFFSIVCFVGWELAKRTGIKDPKSVDLMWERPQIESYEILTIDPVTTFWREMGQLCAFWRKTPEVSQ